MTEINSLPGEMMMRMFCQLPPRDLKMAVLVSNKWRTIGEDPSLWKWCRITVRCRDDINKLSIGRLRDIEEICVNPSTSWEDGDWAALFHATLNLPKLKKIDGLGGVNLTSVEPGLFARTLSRLETVNLSTASLLVTNITVDQMQALFQAVSQNSQLKELNLSYNNLSTVELGLLVTVVSRLEVASLRFTNLSTEQLTSILSHVQEGTKLKKLSLVDNDLASVDPTVLATAVNRLEDVDLQHTMVSTEQLTSILSHVQKGTKLKKLWLGGNDLSSVDPRVLATSVNRLKVVDLWYTMLSAEQITSILRHVKKARKLKRLTLCGNDLSSLDPETLAIAVNRLEYVDLHRTKLTTEQLTIILCHVQENTKLKKLLLSGNDLSSVDPTVLATAVNRLEYVDLHRTKFTTEQLTIILCHVQEDTKLKKLLLQ